MAGLLGLGLLSLPVLGIGQSPPSPDEATLILINGDALKGRHLGTRDDGTIIFESPVLGRIEVSGERARIVNGDLGTGGEPSAKAVVNLGAATVAAESAEESDVGEIGEDPSEEQEPVKPKYKPLDIPLLNWVKYPEIWKGRLRFGLDYQEGERDKFNVNIENAIRIPREHDVFLLNMRYEYEEQGIDNRVRRDRYKGRFRYDYNFGEHRFFNAETDYQVDQIRLINHELRQSLGYGFKWQKAEKYEFQVVPSVTGSFTDQENPAEDFDEFTLFGRLFQAFNYKLTENYSVNQSFEGFVSPLDIDQFDMNFRLGLLGSLTAQLALELDYEFDYDNRVADEIAREDSRLRANLIYKY